MDILEKNIFFFMKFFFDRNKFFFKLSLSKIWLESRLIAFQRSDESIGEAAKINLLCILLNLGIPFPIL